MPRTEIAGRISETNSALAPCSHLLMTVSAQKRSTLLFVVVLYFCKLLLTMKPQVNHVPYVKRKNSRPAVGCAQR